MAWREYRDLLRQMEYDMQRFTEDSLRGFLEHPSAMSRFWQPAADIHETDSGIVIKLELAGVTVEDVSVALSGNGRELTVSGVRSETISDREERTGCHLLEIYYGPFERTFPLPPEGDIDRDAITATLKDGFLIITLPRRLEISRMRTIPIQIVSTE